MGCCCDAADYPSGLTFCDKYRYALGAFSAYIISFAVGGLREVYTTMFGADVKTMSGLFAVLAIWNVVNEILISYMQDKEYLNRFFPTKSWGRRAGWLATHAPICILAVMLGYMVKVLGIEDGSDQRAARLAKFVAVLFAQTKNGI